MVSTSPLYIYFALILIGLVFGFALKTYVNHFIKQYIKQNPEEQLEYTETKFKNILVYLLSIAACCVTYYFLGMTWIAIPIFIFLFLLIPVLFIDIAIKIIPDQINYLGMLVGLILGGISQFAFKFSGPITTGLLDSVFGILLGAGLPLAIIWVYYLITKKIGFGLGDVKMLGFFGAFFGWFAVIPILFISSIFGSIYGLLFVFAKKRTRYEEIPFGPWLVLAALLYTFRYI